MSLINDALRRANQAQKQRLPEQPPGAPLQPVEYQRKSNKMLLLVGPVALVVLGLGGWFFLQAGKSLPAQKPIAEGSKPAATGQLSPASQPTSAAVKPPEAEQTKPAIKINTNLVARTNFVAPAAGTTPTTAPVATAATIESTETKTNVVGAATGETAAEPPASFPVLNLHAIYYRLARSSAVINGRTLYVGDRIEQARVVAIDRQSVTLVLAGRTNVLTMP